MPEYAFEDVDTGEVISIYQSMHDAVPFGHEVVLEGRKLRRLAECGQSPIVSKGVAHVAHSLPEWSPGAHSYEADGTPRFDGQRDIDAFQKANPQFTHNNIKR